LSPNLSPSGPGPRRVPSPRRAPLGRRAPLCFLEKFVTKPLLAGVRSPASVLSETRPSGAPRPSVLLGEVCHQTSPRRGHAPGEPPLRDASLRSAAPLYFLERFVTKPLLAGVTPPASLLSETPPSGRPRPCTFWRGLSPNLSSPGSRPRRASSPRRLPPVGRAPVLFGEVCHQTSPRRGHAPGEPPLRDASLRSAAPLYFLERFVTKPLLAGVTPPASLLSETPPSGRPRPSGARCCSVSVGRPRGISPSGSGPRRASSPRRAPVLIGEVCHQTSPRRGHAPGEPPLRDAPLCTFWRGLSPNLSSPGPGPRRVPSPRRAPPGRRVPVLIGEVCHQTSPRRGHAPGEPPLRDASLRSAAPLRGAMLQRERRETSRQVLSGEVCHQTSPRRGQVPGEPPLRDAFLRSAVVLRERWETSRQRSFGAEGSRVRSGRRTRARLHVAVLGRRKLGRAMHHRASCGVQGPGCPMAIA
jgi:hypothetical protein